ncbi:uncharacterized protein CTRU02_214952 [Colletotrichum truncatum]|uniref:Uncharacterized protein n=1 Tax=Colletotrichum truncatum TaxID=5467 RepID=A0ACC3YE91_COLTU|nr:uncharacterized protein CTRU02_08295 [Colletotrichum truncatum]KAF6790166.1 hypothetical protein CTRU02_08295 [Colletotrichum truncatum]
MQLSLFSVVGLVVSSTAGVIPDHAHGLSRDVSPRLKSPFERRDTFDCEGHSLCGALPVSACDQAANKLIRNDDVNYGASGNKSGKPKGECTSIVGPQLPGCGVYIQGGSQCMRTGNQMWSDYQEIRNNDCKTCGRKQWGDGCMTVINYVVGCNPL